MRHNVTMKVHLHLGPSPGLYVTMVMLLYYKQHDKFHFPPFARLDCGALRCSVFKMTLFSHFAALFCRTVGRSKTGIIILLVADFQNRVFIIQLLSSNPGWKEGEILAPADKLSLCAELTERKSSAFASCSPPVPYFRCKEILPSSDPSSLLSLGGFGDYLHHARWHQSFTSH